MAARAQDVVTRFMEECGRDEPHLLTRSDGSIFVNSEGTLYYDRAGRGRWGRGAPARNIPLAIFIGDRFKGGFMLLNGDGMEDLVAMDWQTRIREQAQARFGWEKCAILPFSALNAAELDLYSIRIIEVTQDRQEPVVLWLPELKPAFDELVKDPAIWIAKHKFTTWLGYTHFEQVLRRGSQYTDTLITGKVGSRQLRINLSRNDIVPDGELGHFFMSGNTATMYAQPENGTPTWNTLTFDTTREEWYWRQMVHRLGAVVFSAIDTYGDKARWLSAFDTHEPEPLYFLAQLPAKGKINTYGDAITALAPPMVKSAMEKSIPVFRQGDVFAVQTDWTDEQVYQVAKTRVRRLIALQDPIERYARRERLFPPHEGELSEKINCPHCNSSKIEAGCGPKAKAALMILHTGHTADEVVFTEDGRTFIKGTMHHDPTLETPGRLPDHRPVVLTSDKWFLCIRNTVPRMKERTTVVNNNDIRIKMPEENTRPISFFASENLHTIADPPTGYNYVEFRVPQHGDIWLSNRGAVKAKGSSASSIPQRKRWILRPVEQTEAEAQGDSLNIAV